MCFVKKPAYIKSVKAYERDTARRRNNEKDSTRFVISDSALGVVFKVEEQCY